MFDILKTRLDQKHRTARYPKAAPVLPDRFRGRPRIDSAACDSTCSKQCMHVCPVGAVIPDGTEIAIDTGICLFCGKCEAACPQHRISFTGNHQLAAANRGDLIVRAAAETTRPAPCRLDDKRLRLFRRTFKLRQVSAGGCNACEADTNVLNTLVFDLARFGIQFVASPRHADGILVTGPVSKNMELALKKTWDAVPAPKVVIAVGACAVSGGMFRGHPQTGDGASALPAVDLFIPGCPPHPYTILDGLLRMLDRL